MRKLIYLVNPKSGTQKKDGLVELIKTTSEEYNAPYSIQPTNAEGDYHEIEATIAREGYTDIVVCGGDGTVNQAINALAHTGVNFGIIPMGSGNGLALSAGLHVDEKKALHTIFTGVSRYTDAFLINNEFACMLCGLGFDATIAHQFATSSRRGLATYATLTTKNIFNNQTWAFDVEVDGKVFNTEAFFISIANSNQFGNNITIAPKADLADGLLDIVIVKKNAMPVLLMQVLQQVLTGKVKEIEKALNSPVSYFQTKSLRIINKDMAPMHIDGEPRDTAAEIVVKVLPDHFKLIYEK